MYKELNDRLKKVLNFKGSAVAVALSNDKPELERLDEKIRLCEMLNEALNEGRSFYTSSEEHACDGGAYHIGLREMPVELRSGEFLYRRVGIFGSARAARRFFSSNQGVEPGTLKYASFSPLDKANFEPDVVVLVCSAKDGMRAVEASAYESGKAAKGNSGPICSTIMAVPYLTGDIVYTLGDLAGRRFSKIDDGEIFIGVPFEKMDELVNGLEKIAERHH
ncbi:MAG: DUF169 domain-containing protein [Methanotrichaceae archaeon]|nr:DUF169 domain-containing protein [Methanotrichaceae archaeon]